MTRKTEELRKERRIRDSMNRWKWRFLVAWIIVFSAAVVIIIRQSGKQNDRARDLAIENAHRITDIQESRELSCRQTYKVIDTILLLSAKGQKLTPAQQERFNELRALVNPARCKKQVHTKVPTKSRKVTKP